MKAAKLSDVNSSFLVANSQNTPNNPVNVQVLVRCRPPNAHEKDSATVIKTFPHKREVQVAQKIMSTGKEIEKTFTFDCVYGASTTQKELFDKSIKNIVDEMLQGYNCTIFAYGQTSTGKTYTMEGERSQKTNTIIDSKAGVIPRSVNYIFSTLDALNTEYSVKVSCLELYNEDLQDLLADDSVERTQLRIFDDATGKRGTVVQGQEEMVVKNATHILAILDNAAKKRQIAETQLNKHSSRSHLITCITIHTRETTSDGEELIKTGKLNLVDLAGSENIGRSGALNKRAKEAGMINQSLLTLGRVITALCQHQPHVPYRESKLTRLLQDSLGGKTRTCIIATISPSQLCLEESLSTLEYAHRAKNIQNKPEVNVKISKAVLIKEMSVDIDKLRAELQCQREKYGVYMSNEQYKEQQELISKQAIIIKEQEIRVELLRKNLEEMEEQWNTMQTELFREREEHTKTRQSLEESIKLVAELKIIQEKQHQQIAELQFLVERHEKSQKTLATEAQTLLANLREAQQDIQSLEQKIERKDETEKCNNQEFNTFQQDIKNHMLMICQESTFFQERYKTVHQQFADQFQLLCKNQQSQYEDILRSLTNICGFITVKQESVQNELELFHKQHLSTFLATTIPNTLDSFKQQVKGQLSEIEQSMKSFVAKLNHALQGQINTVIEMKIFAKEQIADKQDKLVKEFVTTHANQIQQLNACVMEQYAAKQKLELGNQKEMLDLLLAQQIQLQSSFKQDLLFCLQKEIEKHQHTQLVQLDLASKQVYSSIDEHDKRLEDLQYNWKSGITNLAQNVECNLQEPMATIHKDAFEQQLLSQQLPRLQDSIEQSFKPAISAMYDKYGKQGEEMEKLCLINMPSSFLSLTKKQEDLSQQFYHSLNQATIDVQQGVMSNIADTQPIINLNLKGIAEEKQQIFSNYSASSNHEVTQFTEDILQKQLVNNKMLLTVQEFTQNKLKHDHPLGDTPLIQQRSKKRRVTYEQYKLPELESSDKILQEFKRKSPSPSPVPPTTISPIDKENMDLFSQNSSLPGIIVEQPSSPVKDRRIASPTKATRPLKPSNGSRNRAPLQQPQALLKRKPANNNKKTNEQQENSMPSWQF